MTEPVSPPYKLPPVTLTAAKLADELNAQVNDLTAAGKHELAWASAVSAAAIRECEASREANAAVSEIPGDLEKVDLTQAALGAAMQDYDALRNWRKP